MPELPEVETVKRGLEPALLHKRIAAVTLNRPDLRIPITPGFREKCEGARVSALIRRGKYLVALLGNGWGFVLHLGMSGRIHIHAPDFAYHPARHDHVVFRTEEGGTIVFNDPRRFGMLYLVRAEAWEIDPAFADMGPEPMGNEFHSDALAARVRGRRGPIKTVLLDQKVVAGVGNIYACEALYQARIHPEKAAGKLSAKECARLASAVKDVLQRAIDSGGSSLKDYKKTDGTLGYFQHSFAVYDRAGKPCPDCDCDVAKTGGVQKFTQAGRSTFYCPRKQPKS